MGRGPSAAVEVPTVAEPATADDHRLVAAVRRGDDRAFEALYERYHRRITAYVMGKVKDHGRAEDVTQEVFLSALRRMRETERPIAFKPWIYEIAKNACIDQFRRSRRSEEVSFDAEEGLAPADYRKLVGSEPAPDAAVAAKQELHQLCGAFGGLSDTHHEILLLRELEGLSYREIGERLGMSRPAVESTLFRARRRLSEEYDELVSGARCRRIQSVIARAGHGRLGVRDSRRLARHVSHCQACRREALAAGMDSAALTHVPLRRRAAAKIAALLPLPGFLRFGRDRGDEAAASIAASTGGAGQSWMAHLPLVSEQVGGWAKMAAAATALVVGAGAAGVGPQHSGADRDGAAARADRVAVDERRDAAQRTSAQSVFSGGSSDAVRPSGGERGARGDRDRTRLRERRRDVTGTIRDGERRTSGTTTQSDADSGSGGAGVTTGGDAAGGTPVDSPPSGGTHARPKVPVLQAPTKTEAPAATEPVEDVTPPPVEPVGDGSPAPVPDVTGPVDDVTEPIQDVTGSVTDGEDPTSGVPPLPPPP